MSYHSTHSNPHTLDTDGPPLPPSDDRETESYQQYCKNMASAGDAVTDPGEVYSELHAYLLARPVSGAVLTETEYLEAAGGVTPSTEESTEPV